jgi:hypothetical protein
MAEKKWNPGHPFTIVVSATRRMGELQAKEHNLPRGQYRIYTPGGQPDSLRGIAADQLFVVGSPALSVSEMEVLEQCFLRSDRKPFKAVPIGDL